MAGAQKAQVVAVLNSNEDLVETVQFILADAGFMTVGAHLVDFKKGRKDFVAFLKEHDPIVIIVDIAPPYEENWQFFHVLKNAQEAADRHFVLTTTNKTVLEGLVGQTETIEIVGKPFDLDEIVTAVQKLAQGSNCE